MASIESRHCPSQPPCPSSAAAVLHDVANALSNEEVGNALGDGDGGSNQSPVRGSLPAPDSDSPTPNAAKLMLQHTHDDLPAPDPGVGAPIDEAQAQAVVRVVVCRRLCVRTCVRACVRVRVCGCPYTAMVGWLVELNGWANE